MTIHRHTYRLISIAIASAMTMAVASAQAYTVADTLGFETSAALSVGDLLSGKISGVRISKTDGGMNSARSISIRGINSLRGDNTPLIIVDGVILGSSMNMDNNAFWQDSYNEETYTPAIDPLAFICAEDIESIEVLKDISATAVYGSRGANGVILITTCKGKGENLDINWNSTLKAYPGISHKHYFSIGESNNRTSFNVSANFRDNRTDVFNTGRMGGGLKIQFESSANNYVKFGFNALMNMDRISNTSGTAWFGKGSATLAMRDDNLSPGTSLQGWKQDYDDDTKSYRAVSSAYLTINFTPNIEWRTTFGIDYYKAGRVLWYGNETDFGYVNNGAAAAMNTMTLSTNAGTAFRYNRYINTHHHISTLLSAELTGQRNSWNTMNGVNYFTHELRGDGLSLMQSQKQPHKSVLQIMDYAAAAGLSYDYRRWAGINAGLRADFSPEFNDAVPVLYPYVDAYVDLHQILFSGNTKVSGLKVRAGYGQSGFDRVMPFVFIGNFLTGSYIAVPDEGSNYYKGLNRVLAGGWNLAVETAFLNDRISLSASYYDNKVRDIFYIYSFGEYKEPYWREADRLVAYDRESGMANRGLELDFAARIIDKPKVSWDIFLNAACEMNRMTSVAKEDMYGFELGSGLTGNINVEGLQASSVFGYKENADGTYLDNNRDGRISGADMVILGNTTPRLHGGLSTTLNCYGFVLDVETEGAADYKLVNLNALALAGKSDISESYVEDADFFRLSRVSLGYDIPLKAKWIESLKVSVSALNLLTATGYSGWNPAVSSYGNYLMMRGYDYGSYRLPKSIIIGINAKF